MSKAKEADSKHFNLLVIIFLGGLTAWLLANEYSTLGFLCAISTLGVLMVIIWRPHFLLPFNRAWMSLGYNLGKIMNPVVITLLYITLIVPFAVVCRIGKRDELRLKKINANSFWRVRSESIDPDSFKQPY